MEDHFSGFSGYRRELDARLSGRFSACLKSQEKFNIAKAPAVKIAATTANEAKLPAPVVRAK